jgi:hypothetical protein
MALALLVCTLAGCGSEPAAPRRLFAEQRNRELSPLTVAGTTRWGLSMPRQFGVLLVSPVRDVGPGTLRAYFAVETLTSHAETTARMTVTARDWQARASDPFSVSCEVRWAEQQQPPRWQPCEI